MRLILVTVVVAVCAFPLQALASTAASTPPQFKNCTALNKRYPHGVGKLTARDKTTGERVTTFFRSTKLYLRAMSFNKRLDGDKDGIACEKE